jgi:hypothetical protein
MSAPDPNARIRRARITKMPERLLDPMPEVYATLDDDSEHRLFSYYPDEITFTPEDFIGLTIREAHALKARRDIDYLRS